MTLHVLYYLNVKHSSGFQMTLEIMNPRTAHSYVALQQISYIGLSFWDLGPGTVKVVKKDEADSKNLNIN